MGPIFNESFIYRPKKPIKRASDFDPEQCLICGVIFINAKKLGEHIHKAHYY